MTTIPQEDETRLFFIHIMKTAGSTFRRYVRRNLPPEAVYPQKSDGDMFEIASVSRLRAIPPERHQVLLAYLRHFPAAAASFGRQPLVTATILRDPVERTISYLKQCRRTIPEHGNRTLEEIYDDPVHFPMLIHNHQSKVFSHWVQTRNAGWSLSRCAGKSWSLPLERLAAIDLIGDQACFDQFVAKLRRRFGWSKPLRRRLNEGDQMEVSSSLRDRIEEDNAIDREFYQFAKKLMASRPKRLAVRSRLRGTDANMNWASTTPQLPMPSSTADA